MHFECHCMLFRNLWNQSSGRFRAHAWRKYPFAEASRLPHQIDLFLSLWVCISECSFRNFELEGVPNLPKPKLTFALLPPWNESTCILVWLPADALSSGHINGMVLRTSSMPGLSFCSSERTPMFHRVFQYTLSCKIFSRFGGQVLMSIDILFTPAYTKMLNDRWQWWGMVRQCC